jgi:DNA-binding response OmpR family regulator
MKKILVIEDDVSVARGVREILSAENMQVFTAQTASGGLAIARTENIDLIILDLKLPDGSGEDICRDLRSEGNPAKILMLTSKKKEIDQVVGLEIGANDYVTKPFSASVLVARVKALLRPPASSAKRVEEYSFGDVYVDFRKQEVLKGRKKVKLSTRELDVLHDLISHEGEVVTREDLLNRVWGYERYPTTRTVDNYILSLRRKLERDPTHPGHIMTIHTSGYKFVKQ